MTDEASPSPDALTRMVPTVLLVCTMIIAFPENVLRLAWLSSLP